MAAWLGGAAALGAVACSGDEPAAGSGAGGAAPGGAGGEGGGAGTSGGGGGAGEDAKKASGEPCSAGAECQSGMCADAVCCNASCAGPCEQCAAPGSAGSCTPQPAGADPEAGCAGGACDGAGQCASGAHRFSRLLGGKGTGLASKVAFDKSGNLFVSGSFDGEIDLGKEAGKLVSAGAEDVLLVKLTPDGNLLWGRRFGDAAAQHGDALVPDCIDNVFVAGRFFGAIDLGGGPLLANKDGDAIYLAKLGGAGEHLWSKSFSGQGEHRVEAMGLGASAFLVLGGEFDGSASFGGGELVSAGTSDVFITKLDLEGAHLWSSSRARAEPTPSWPSSTPTATSCGASASVTSSSRAPWAWP
ncbi:MAG: hypothetical protein HY744_31680 [Deltaproteobacteria bacterium]|nr:hypothetical protein [Deltaproteobacteria bacterium]